jgi:hypothetical protein
MAPIVTAAAKSIAMIAILFNQLPQGENIRRISRAAIDPEKRIDSGDRYHWRLSALIIAGEGKFLRNIAE